LIAEVSKFADWAERDRVAREWLGARDPVAAVLELLTAGEEMRPFPRTMAVGLARAVAGAGRPAWQQAADWPRIGPHAREVLTFSTDGGVSDRDWRWLVVERAAADLEAFGPDRALTRIWRGMPGEGLREKVAAAGTTGHPDNSALLRALEEFLASGASRSIDQVAVLKVTLAGFRPPVWRRIQVPVIQSLATLHWAIQALFGWDGDHLYVFEAGDKRYGVADMTIEDAADAGAVTIQEALAADGAKLEYTYDFGADWRHEITLEKTIERDPGTTYPVCVAYKGDQPVEYWSEDDQEDPEPFDLAAVNRSLANLADDPA
jgi:hypothetical protein